MLQALKGLEEHTQILNSHTQSIAKLETQIGQLATALSRREEGKLPSQPISNPVRSYKAESSTSPANFPEQAKVVMTLRSGRTLNQPDLSQENKIAEPEKPSHAKGKEPIDQTPAPKVPFPQALKLPFEKTNVRMNEMLELFKQVQINLPLLDAIKQVPSYAKFLKDLCTQKRKAKIHTKKIQLTEQASSVFQQLAPPKLKDPGTPTISCVIGNLTIRKALLDLGASVNLLPSSMYDSCRFGELKSTKVTLQLADRSVKTPHGIIEDVLVKVDEFYFPVDFLVLDMESSNHIGQIPIILGRPFLATANACINCRTGVMDVSFGNKKMRLNVFGTSQGTPVYIHDEVNMIEEGTKFPLDFDPLQDCLAHFDINTFDIEGYTQEVNSLLEPPKFDTTPSWTDKYQHNPTQPSPARSTLEAPQLQPLGNLTHSAPTATPPRITTSDQEDQLTIGWTLTNPNKANLPEAKPQNLYIRTLNTEHVEPHILNATDTPDLPHEHKLSLKQTAEQNFTPHKLFRANITKFKSTIKGSSYFPT